MLATLKGRTRLSGLFPSLQLLLFPKSTGTHPSPVTEAVTTTTVRAPSAPVPAPMTPTPFQETVVPERPTIVGMFNNRGAFRYQPVFKYNELTVSNYLQRKAVLFAIASSERDLFMALPFSQRRAFFAFLKQETNRYYGRALRQRDTAAGLRGTPLPALVFPTRMDAAAYRELLQNAMRRIGSHIKAGHTHDLR